MSHGMSHDLKRVLHAYNETIRSIFYGEAVLMCDADGDAKRATCMCDAMCHANGYATYYIYTRWRLAEPWLSVEVLVIDMRMSYVPRTAQSELSVKCIIVHGHVHMRMHVRARAWGGVGVECPMQCHMPYASCARVDSIDGDPIRWYGHAWRCLQRMDGPYYGIYVVDRPEAIGATRCCMEQQSRNACNRGMHAIEDCMQVPWRTQCPCSMRHGELQICRIARAV